MSFIDSTQVTELFDEISSQLSQQLLTQEIQEFDYAVLTPQVRTLVQSKTSELKSLMRRSVQDIIEIGQKLTEVKQQLGYGNFRNWLKAEFDWGIWTATKFMQVAEKFECVNFTHLDIAASALYLLAAPSTPDIARKEALELATQGKTVSYTKAKTIVAQHKEVAKSKAPKVTVDVPAETALRNSSTPAELRPTSQNVEARSAAVVEQSDEDKLPGKKTEAPVYSQVSNHFHNIALTADSGDYSLEDQAQINIQSLFCVGHLIYLTDSEQQESKLLGEVAEVKEVTATEVVIRISLEYSQKLSK